MDQGNIGKGEVEIEISGRTLEKAKLLASQQGIDVETLLARLVAREDRVERTLVSREPLASRAEVDLA